jgi:penicillin-binding protein 1A
VEQHEGVASGGRGWRRRLLLILAGMTGLGVLTVAVAAFAFWRIYSGAFIPAADELAIPEPTRVLDADGEVVDTLEPAAVRRNVALDDLPDHVPDAILAAEDRGFHEHPGFSVRGIVRALWANVRAGSVQQGASTITQQYVALAVEDIDDSYTGKFREVATATRLESEMAKDEILEMYLNAVPFGRSARGIEAAARTYFDVAATDLELDQAATLAGMIAAPTAFDPARNPDGAEARRDFTLDGMVEMGAIDRGTRDEVVGTPLPELRQDPLIERGPNAYFLDAVRGAVPEILEDDRREVGEDLLIHTTLDTAGQAQAHEALRDELAETGYSGSVVTIDNASGAVRTLLGGLDYAEQEFNVAVQGERQAGSSFKTFTLAEFVAQGHHPDQGEVDAPEELEVGEGSDTATVGNYSGRGHGEVTARQATTESINTAYMLLAEEVGYDRVAERAEELGITAELPVVPSLTLGTAGVTPLDMAGAYATLAAGGTRHDPYLIERIETHAGEVLYEHEPDPVEAMEPAAAHVVTDVLEDVVTSGTATAAAIDRPVAGKTGTTDDNVDAWFVGYTVHHTTATWVGNLDNTPTDGVTGGSLPASIWSSFMGPFSEALEPESFPAADTSGLVPFDGSDEDDEDVDRRSREPEDARDEDDDEGDDEADDDERDDDERDDGDEGDEGDGGEGDDEDREVPSEPVVDGDDEGLVDGIVDDDGDDEGSDGSGDGSADDDGSGEGDGDDGSGDDADDADDDGADDDGADDDGSADGDDDGSSDDGDEDGSSDDGGEDGTSDDGTEDEDGTGEDD